MASTSSYDADASSSSAQTGDLLSSKSHKAPKRDLSSLNTELKSHGWSKRSLHLTGLGERETSEVIGIMYEMMGSALSNVENLDALAGRYRTLEYEQDRTAKALNMSLTAQRKSEGDAAGWKMRVTDLERRLALEEAKTKELREDVSRARKAVEAVRIAASQDQRKAQTRYEAAQTRIAKYAADSSSLSGAQGMTVLNPVAPGRSAPVAYGQAALLEQSLRDLTEIREAVQQENEDFRHVVVSTGNALRQTLAITQGEKEASRLQQSQFFTLTPQLRASPYAGSLSPTSTPTFPEIADIRLKSLVAALSSVLTSRIIRVPTSDGAAPQLTPEEVEAQARAERDEQKRTQDLLDKMKDLQVEVECAKQREMEAKKTMEEMTNRQMAVSMAKAGEREKDAEELLGILKERERLEGERREVRAMKEGYDREKRTFDAERKAFQEERRRVDVDCILAQLPGTPSQSTSALPQIDHAGPSSNSASSHCEAPSNYASSSSPSASTDTLLADASFSASASSPSRSRSAHSPRRTRPQIQAQTSWHAHQPASPSPLSPHRPRTPKAHLAGLKGKRVRTPLSRLVLEKAARKSSSDDVLTSSTAKTSAAAEGSKAGAGAAPSAGTSKTQVAEGVKALGDGGRRANTNGTAFPVSTMGASVKGKGRMMGSTISTAGQGEKKRSSPSAAMGSLGAARPRVASSGSTAGSKVDTKDTKVRGQAGAGALGASQSAAAATRGKPVWR